MLPVLPRAERRRIEKIIHKTKDKEHARRLTAILMLHQGHTILSVHRLTAASRSSIQRWLSWYQECGISGLESKHVGAFVLCHIIKLASFLKCLFNFHPRILAISALVGVRSFLLPSSIVFALNSILQLQHSAAGCPELALSGAERRRHFISETRIAMKKWYL